MDLIGKFLKTAREKAALTQAQVAKSLSYSSAQFVSNWERGIALPPLNQLPRLAEIYRIPPKAFLEILHDYQEELLKLQKRVLTETFKARFPRAF
jgi:transcriptional regulator with XRE-family HTH domain